MDRLTALNPQVFVNTSQLPTFAQDDVEFLSSVLETSQVGRARICFHASEQDKLQEMLIVFDNCNYVRPSVHIDKDESLILLEGTAYNIFFSYSGSVSEIIELDKKTGSLYSRVPGGIPHALIICSERFVAKETTVGPFDRSTTVFPEWSPPYDSDAKWLEIVRNVIQFAKQNKSKEFLDRIVIRLGKRNSCVNSWLK